MNHENKDQMKPTSVKVPCNHSKYTYLFDLHIQVYKIYIKHMVQGPMKF